MHEEDHDVKKLTERIKKLEYLQRNTRIAIIVLVGYSIYDVISKDSGSDIVYAHKVKAKEFELVDGVGSVLSSWKSLKEDERQMTTLVIEGDQGGQVRLSSEKLSFVDKARTNPVETLVINSEGLTQTTVKNQDEYTP
jgi:phosphoheptose isomerase